MNLFRLILSLFAPSRAELQSYLIRPSLVERPPRPPAMLVEEVTGGYLLSSRAFCRALPPGFEEMLPRPDAVPGEALPEEPACGWSPPVSQALSRGRLFYVRVPWEWLRSPQDYPGVLNARDWSVPWGGGEPPPREWWLTQYPLAFSRCARPDSAEKEET